MALTKREELANPTSCINKAAEDEPVFVLRGSDVLAPIVIRVWASMAKLLGASQQKVSGALTTADAMDRWPVKKNPT